MKFSFPWSNSTIFAGLVLGVFFLLSNGDARAEGDHLWSFGIAGGWAIAPGAELESNPSVGEAHFDPGYSIKAGLGLMLARTFHLEAEYLFTFHSIDTLVNPPVVTSLVASDRMTHNVMLNATYRWEVPPAGDVYWVRRGYYVYVGGGAGVSWQDYTVETVAVGTDSSLAWQLMIGFEKMNLSGDGYGNFPSPFVQYRFLRIEEGDFGAFQADAFVHALEFGFRFYGGL